MKEFISAIVETAVREINKAVPNPLAAEVSGLKDEVSELKAEIKSIKRRETELKNERWGIEHRLDTSQNRLIAMTAEKEKYKSLFMQAQNDWKQLLLVVDKDLREHRQKNGETTPVG